MNNRKNKTMKKIHLIPLQKQKNQYGLFTML